MRTVSLQGTALSTSRLGFGTSGLHQILRSRARQSLLSAAYELGIRHFDTSPFYGHGIAERELGLFARRRRGDLLIATKFGVKPNAVLSRLPWLMYPQLAANAAQRRLTKTNRLALLPARDYGAREARRSLERSLRLLRTDHVDVYFVHDANAALIGHGEELWETLAQLQREGKTRYVGLAGNARDGVELAGRFPGMAQIMQINAAPGAQQIDLLADAALPCHVTFGHFRGRNADLQSLLAEAMSVNRHGVILYSSRYPARLAELVSLLSERDV